MINEDRQAQFLKELAELSRKHGILIGGCGCCGSPYLYEDPALNGKYRTNGDDDLSWIEDSESQSL